MSDPCFRRRPYMDFSDIRRADSLRYGGFRVHRQKWIFFSAFPTSMPRINLRPRLLNVAYRLTRFASPFKIPYLPASHFFLPILNLTVEEGFMLLAGICELSDPFPRISLRYQALGSSTLFALSVETFQRTAKRF